MRQVGGLTSAVVPCSNPVRHSASNELAALARRLGDHPRDLVVLAEGNASLVLNDGTILISASGASLRDLKPSETVVLRPAPLVDFVADDAPANDRSIRETLTAATVGSTEHEPSVEAFVHAVCCRVPGVRAIAHTHPTAIVGLLCSGRGRELTSPLFPEQASICGPRALLICYRDPGVPLARELLARLVEFIGEYRRPPAAVLLEQHGLLTLGASAAEVEGVTLMMAKVGRVLVAAGAGGAQPLDPCVAERFWDRADQRRRRTRLFGAPTAPEPNGT